MTSNLPTQRLARFFAGTAEHTFEAQLGVVDPPLVDYVSNLLIRFVRNDAPLPRGVTGRRLADIGEMISEATERLGDAQRQIHCQIGDFALFWAGLFPEALRSGKHGDVDRFLDYCSHGKRAYLVAAEIETDEEHATPSDLLRRLGDRFELCAYGLREVRREWERQDDEPDGAGPLLLN